MKPIHSLFFAVCLSLFILSCKETPPYINMVPSHVSTDSTSVFLPAPTPEEKHVLIEEFSGVKCKNCPAAQQEAAKISSNNLNKIHIITIHPLGINNTLTTPFAVKDGDAFNSTYDFRTAVGANIYNLVGPGVNGGLPMGTVNRKFFSGEPFRNMNYQNWAAHVNSELTIPTPVNIKLSAKNIGDSVSIEVTLLYTDYPSDTNHFLTLSLIESGMIDYQESTDINGVTIFVKEYVHKHVLRAIVTADYGDILKAKLEPGRIFFKKYSYKRDPSWVKTNLDIVAMVHLNTTKQDIIHSKEVHVE